MKPIAFISSNRRYSQCVVASPVLEMGWIQWVEEYGPKLQEQGYDVMFHNPGGQYWPAFVMPDDHVGGEAFKQAQKRGLDTRGMWIDQWQKAEQIGVAQADRNELAAAHAMLRELYGVERIIYYLGSPIVLRDPVKEGMKCLEPFLLPGASIAFDNLFTRWQESNQLYWKGKEDERDKQCGKLVTKLRKAGFPVFYELRDGINGPKVDGTIAESEVDKRYHPDMDEHYGKGEAMRIAYSPVPLAEIQSWDKRITPIVAAWETIKASELA